MKGFAPLGNAGMQATTILLASRAACRSPTPWPCLGSMCGGSTLLWCTLLHAAVCLQQCGGPMGRPRWRVICRSVLPCARCAEGNLEAPRGHGKRLAFAYMAPNWQDRPRTVLLLDAVVPQRGRNAELQPPQQPNTLALSCNCPPCLQLYAAAGEGERLSLSLAEAEREQKAYARCCFTRSLSTGSPLALSPYEAMTLDN